jgi:hypothetical protein
MPTGGGGRLLALQYCKGGGDVPSTSDVPSVLTGAFTYTLNTHTNSPDTLVYTVIHSGTEARYAAAASPYCFFPVLMNPALRPSNPARSSFFSLLAFLLSSLVWERAARLSLRL